MDNSSLSTDDIRKILYLVDHTVLSTTATKETFEELVTDGIKYNVASVCVPPSRVSECAKLSDGRLPICTVIGFPNGYNTTETKLYEAREMLLRGVDELDVVINIEKLKDGDFAAIQHELASMKKMCDDKILKVIVETSALTKEELITMCNIVSESGADFIKTSTGFGSRGCSEEDIIIMRDNIAPHVKIKASGGISTLEQGKRLIELGASRLGTSRLVRYVKEHNLL